MPTRIVADRPRWNPFRRRWGLVIVWRDGTSTPLSERFWLRSSAVLRQTELAHIAAPVDVVPLD